jgi:hypothetical protein
MKNGLIPFLILISILNISCNNNEPTTDGKQSTEVSNEAYVIFIQSDSGFKGNDNRCFDYVWQEKGIIHLLFARLSRLSNTKIYLYPLNAQTANAIPLFSTDTPSVREAFAPFKVPIVGTPYTIERKKKKLAKELRGIVRDYAEKHEAILGDPDKAKVQNIRDSIEVLENLTKGDLKEASIIKVIYLSDMIHYDTTGITSDEEDQFNFMVPYSLELFDKKIRVQGMLKNDYKLESLLTNDSKQSLYIFTVSLPCDRKPLSYPRPKLDAVWQTVFTKIGARPEHISLNHISIDPIFK